jgi:hypothetical protein
MITRYLRSTTRNSIYFGKRILVTGLVILLRTMTISAQIGVEGIVVERIPVTAGAVADDPNLPPDAIAYRVFVDMSPGFEMQAVFAETNTSIMFGTTTFFYNNSDLGSATGGDILNSQLAGHPALGYDSYITINAATNSRLGIPMAEDTTDGTVDGYVNGTALPLQSIGADFEAPFGYNDFSGVFSANDCVYNVLGGEQGPTESNRVLIGQFTTNGAFRFKFNIQIRAIASSAIEQYMAENPSGLQYSHPELHYPGPSVFITSPQDESLAGTEQNLEILAEAGSSFGISHVSFFVHDDSITTDSTLPYRAVWNTIPGTAEIYAVAWDSLGLADTSALVNITVQDLAVPTVSITSPLVNESFPVNQPVTITVTAGDTDGNVTRVEFFANSVLIGQDDTAPYSFNWTPATAGTVVLYALATDDDQLQTASAEVSVNITSISGLDEPVGEGMIRIFPNPANEFLTIEIVDWDRQNVVLLEITDLHGRSFFKKEYDASVSVRQFESVSLSGFPAGIYHIRLSRTDGSTITRKIIKD